MTDLGSFVLPDEEIRRQLSGASAGDVVLIAQQCLRFGSFDSAIAICRAFRESGESDPAIALTEAAALFGAGDQQTALALVDEVLRAHPGHPAASFYKAQMLVDRRQLEPALKLLLATIRAFPDFPGALGRLAALFMPGPHYRDVLGRMHRLLRPKTYLEIGVETGATLALAAASRVAVGVDPDPRPLRRELVPPNGRVYHERSSEFFARRTRGEIFGDEPLELAFIDGMHLYEFALADFIAAERWCAPTSTIVLHDLVPVVPLTAERERRTKFWVGDLWKLLPILAEYRPDLKISLVPCAPSGLVVVRRLDPESGVLAAKLDEIERRYRDARYPYGELEWPAGVRRVENSEAGLREALA